jgi:hypothetical protein|tara:strand:+ start:165 stop:602 length:438 start_codon:yes stop_codon:yes gene_type:complete
MASINKWLDAEKDKLKGDLGKVGTPGYSERRKSELRSNAEMIAAQNTQIQQRELNRASLAQGAGWQGGYAQQANQLANAGALAGAQAGMQAEQMSKDVAAARDAQIRADLARQADLATMRNKELGGLLVDGGKIAAGIPPTPKPA